MNAKPQRQQTDITVVRTVSHRFVAGDVISRQATNLAFEVLSIAVDPNSDEAVYVFINERNCSVDDTDLAYTLVGGPRFSELTITRVVASVPRNLFDRLLYPCVVDTNLEITRALTLKKNTAKFKMNSHTRHLVELSDGRFAASSTDQIGTILTDRTDGGL
jgi:hypothetical protein